MGDSIPLGTFCLQMTKRYALLTMAHKKEEGRPQELFSRDGEYLSYDEAEAYVRGLTTELVPCAHADETGRCRGSLS